MTNESEKVLKLELEPTQVPTFNGEMQTVNPGDIWPAPYRGSRYTIRLRKRPEDGRHQYQLFWTRQEALYHRKLFPGLKMGLENIKGSSFAGSIRITSWREVLCKKYDPLSDKWIAHYVGKLEGNLVFNGFDINPDIKCGQFWRGFHFKHGETWSVWVRSGSGDHLYWSRKGVYFRSLNEHPELVQKVREIRPRGGRCYVTEHGHVWMNLPNGEESPHWSTEIRNLIIKDTQEFKDPKWDDLIESISERFTVTKTRPIYVGKVSDFDDGKPPRTFFANANFNEGSKNEDVDDEDGFASPGYRNMRRDVV